MTTDFFDECTADLTMPKNFRDTTYKNDACPSWGFNVFQIFIDHPDPNERELGPEKPRFCIMLEKDYGDTHTWSYECETWEEVLKTVSIRSCYPPSVSEEWQMDCPECGRDEKIFINGRVELLLTPDGTENTCSNFADWDDNSYAHCGHCFFEGTVKNFKIPADFEGCNGGIITFDKENA